MVFSGRHRALIMATARDRPACFLIILLFLEHCRERHTKNEQKKKKPTYKRFLGEHITFSRRNYFLSDRIVEMVDIMHTF